MVTTNDRTVTVFGGTGFLGRRGRTRKSHHGHGLKGRVHSESSANPLIHLGPNSSDYSECGLISLKVLPDFDSTIRRFESSRPSQPPVSHSTKECGSVIPISARQLR